MPNPTMSDIHIDSALTNMSVAYIQQPSAFIADKVFPIVPVEKQSDRYFVYKKEDFFRDEAQERAIATESAGGGYSIDNTPTYYTTKYAYHKDVTEDERTNADTPLKPDEDAQIFVTQKLLLKREVLWAAKNFKTGVWATDVAGASSNPSTGQFLQWDQDTADPFSDVADGQTAVLATTGFKPNTLVLGFQVYQKLRKNKLILDRIKYTQRGVVTTDILASLFDVDRVLVAQSVKNSAAKGANANISFILGKNALLCYSAPNPGLRTPSAGYTFAWTGLLGAGAYGNRIGRIPMPWLGMGTERIEGEMAFDQKVVGTDLGYFFSGAIA